MKAIKQATSNIFTLRRGRKYSGTEVRKRMWGDKKLEQDK